MAPGATTASNARIDPAELKPGEFWLAPASGETPDTRADELLASLVQSSIANSWIFPGHARHAPEYKAVFVYAGEKVGNQWLTFACSGPDGLSVLTFDRRERFLIDKHAALEMEGQRPWEPGWQPLKWTLLHIAREGLRIRTTIGVNGSPNEVLWSVDPVVGPPPRAANELRLESPLICCRATPLTGWFGFRQGLHGQGDPGNLDNGSNSEPQAWQALLATGQPWNPNIGNILFVQGPQPPRELKIEAGVCAISFLADGRIAAAAPTGLTILDVEGKPAVTRPLPGDKVWTEDFAFSPDGARLFMSGTSRPAWLVDILEGRVRQFSAGTAGMPSVAFSEVGSMVYIDNVSTDRMDWATNVRTPIGIKHGFRSFGFGMAHNLILLPSEGPREHDKLDLINLEDKKVVGTFEQLQGMHQSSLSPDARWVVMKGQSGLRIFDSKSGEIILDHDRDFDFHTARSRIKWSADGTRGATAGSSCVYVWSLKKPYWFARFPHGRHGFWPDVALSPDGKSIAASAQDSKGIAYWPDIDAALPKLAHDSGK